jgi:hypothetical protein
VYSLLLSTDEQEEKVALTKHENLSRSIRQVFFDLDAFSEKVAAQLNVLQFYLSETHLIVGRPLMLERGLKEMMNTHRCRMSILSINAELKSACLEKPLIAWVTTPPYYPESRVLYFSPDKPKNEKRCIPWRVQTMLPSECIAKLQESRLQALLYCPSEDEMADWIDWFEHEDRASTLTNQMRSIEEILHNEAILRRNLLTPALPFFKEVVNEFYTQPKREKAFVTLSKTSIMPKEETSMAQAYDLVNWSMSSFSFFLERPIFCFL